MAGSRKLTVEILGDAKGLGQAFGDAEKSAKSLSDEFDNTEKKSDVNFKKINTAVVGAGVAIAAFAVKGVMDFQDLGLEVGKFSDATGLSAEESSRWIEVAGDVGVEAGTLESIINRMNATAGKSPKTFSDLGVEIAKTKDGATDASGTLLNVIDHLNGIKDPATKAAEGTRLLGRGWKETAELVSRGSDQIRSDLDAVAGNKVLTDEDVGTARGLRNAFDGVGDAVDELLLTLGKNLAPAIVEIADVITEVVEAAGPLVEIIGDGLTRVLSQAKPLLEGVGDAIGLIGDILPTTNDEIVRMEEVFHANVDTLNDAGVSTRDLFERIETGTIGMAEFTKVIEDNGGVMTVYNDIAVSLTEATDELGMSHEDAARSAAVFKGAQEGATSALTIGTGVLAAATSGWDAATFAAGAASDKQYNLNLELEKVKKRVEEQNAAWDVLFGKYNEETAFFNIATNFDELRTKIGETQAAMEAGTTSQEQGMRDVAVEILNTKAEVGRYIEKLGGIDPSIMTSIEALIDEGNYDEVERRLKALTVGRDVIIKAKLGAAPTPTAKLLGFDSGGVVPGPRGSPQLVVAHGGETVLATHKEPASSLIGGGSTIVVNIDLKGVVGVSVRELVNTVADGIVDAQRRGEFPGSFN